MEKFKTNAKRLKDVKESLSDFSQKIRWKIFQNALPFHHHCNTSLVFKSLLTLPFPLCSAVLSWEDPFKSTYALITYILMVLYMELWALPILPILLLLYHAFRRKAGPKSSGEQNSIFEAVKKSV